MNEEGDWRTGLDTPGLLNIYIYIYPLGIWLEMEFTSDALIIDKLFLKAIKINIYITKSLRKLVWKTFLKFCGLWNFLYV